MIKVIFRTLFLLSILSAIFLLSASFSKDKANAVVCSKTTSSGPICNALPPTDTEGPVVCTTTMRVCTLAEDVSKGCGTCVASSNPLQYCKGVMFRRYVPSLYCRVFTETCTWSCSTSCSGVQGRCTVPPAPSVTATASCSGGAGRISTTWSTVAGSNGVDDFRYRRSDSATWITDLDAPEPKVLTGLSSSSTYYVQVRSHTVSNYDGPTAWRQDTAVTADCDAPPPTPTPTPIPTYSISGQVYVDDNGNGTKDGAETGYTGAISVIAVAVKTHTTGTNYIIENIPNGTYTILSSVPAGYIATTATSRIVTVSGASVSGINFGIVPTSFYNPYGNHDTQTCAISSGWTCDRDNFDQALSVHFYDGPGFAKFVGAVTANQTREAAVGALCGGNSNHGFTFDMPSSIYDNGIHSIYAYAINIGRGNSNPLLFNSPRTITCIRMSIIVNVYQDLNGNGVDDGASETGYAGATVTVTGKGAGTYTTNGSGQVVIPNLLPGSSTITVTIPSGWTSTTANPRTITLPPSQTVNFGIQPPAPTCSGGLTADPTSVTPGQTSALRAVGCTTLAQEATLTYSWPAPDYGSTANVNNPNTTWTSPNPWWTQVDAHPSVNVCQTGTTLCTPYGATIRINPRFSVSGVVFLDQNKDKLLNGGESNYTGGITISPNPAGVTVSYPSAGAYVISNMPGGIYTISYTSLPVGYQMTYPLNGPPPSFSIRVGNASTGGACSTGGSNSAVCDGPGGAIGNITDLRYGITNSIPWIQSIGGDMRFDSGFTDWIPPGTNCGSYASLIGSGGTPGIIYSGASSANFGSGQASQDPYNWVVGGLIYPEVYTPLTPGVIRTSYNYINSISQQSNLTPVNIADYCGLGGIADCQLSGSIPNGLYIANGNLNLTGSDYTFPVNKNFVILVNGVLTIQTEIHVPIGSTAFFTSSGNINVASNVGETDITSVASNIEGYYSTDQSFFAQGGDTCPTSDRRLNVAGAIVVNARLNGGAFVNQRDLCAENLTCPAFSVIERPDFILNAPDFMKTSRRIYKEIAP